MSEPVTFIIAGELYSSKNSREPIVKRTKAGKQIRAVVKSAAARRHETELMIYLNRNPVFYHAWLKEFTGRPLPIRLQILIYRKTCGRFDYANICQNLFDCLVKAGFLPDDNADTLLPVYEPYKIDRDNPRTELTML